MHYNLTLITSDHLIKSVKIPFIEINQENENKFIVYINSLKSLTIEIKDSYSIYIVLYNKILNNDMINYLKVNITRKLIPYPIITKFKNLFRQNDIYINIQNKTDEHFALKIQSMIYNIYKEHRFKIMQKN